jgi:hypothetical protein
MMLKLTKKRMMLAPTKKQLAAGQRRSLAAIARKLMAMAYEWNDVDEYNVLVITELAEACAVAQKNLSAEEES